MHWVRSLYSRARRPRPPRSFFLCDPDTNTMAVSSLASSDIFLNIRMNNNYNVSSAKLAEVNVAVSRSCNQLSWLALHMPGPMHCAASGMHVYHKSLVGEVKMQCCELPTE